MDLALLLLRIVVGLLVAGHGAQKLFGWFGGHGLAGFAGSLESMRFRAARLWAWLAGLTEFGGGVLLATGWLSARGWSVVASSVLAVTARVLWPHGGSVERR